jgi:hypothetical protein
VCVVLRKIETRRRSIEDRGRFEKDREAAIYGERCLRIRRLNFG